MATKEFDADGTITPEGLRDDPEIIEEECLSFLRSVVGETDADGVVVGLSGGLDSTTTATLAVEALGNEDVYGLVLPADSSDTANVHDAQQVAYDLGINFRTVDVQPIVDALTDTLGQEFWLRRMGTTFTAATSVRLCDPVDHGEDYTEAVGNATARARMAALYFEANLGDRLVLGTGNRTELSLGYFTKYGDGGVDLLPIGHLYKTEVRRLARHLDVPEEIVEKPPTAGLWDGQTDAGELGASYETIDAVLRKLVDEECTIERTAAVLGIDRELVAEYAEMYEAAAHKRSTPPTPETRFS